MDTENLQNKIQSKQFRKIMIFLSICVLALVVFELGTQFGYMKASFSYRHGENYYRPLDNHGVGFFSGDPASAHGASGKIISINASSIVVADSDSTEKVVNVEPETIIRKFRDTITAADLAPGDYVVVIGEPNETAEVDAKFIRVVPPPPTVNTPPAAASVPAAK